MTRQASLAMGILGGALAAGACGGSARVTTSPDGGAPDGGGGGPYPVTGCATTSAPPVAPGGYYVNGNTICTADGHPHLLHGVDRPSLEWTSAGDSLMRADFRRIASWNANVVRFALNQDFWLAASPSFEPSYAPMVDAVIGWAEAEGMDVILDLHWSDRGVLGSCGSTANCQQQMPDANSVTFWSEVATRYRDDGHVMFELYNEPHDVNWEIWRAGGATSDGFLAVGMQQLYDTVRATGAETLVLLGGLNWGYDLSGVPAHRIDGHNIAYVSHPYNSAGRRSYDWDRSWGALTRTDPVVLTEFGDTSESCSTDYTADLLAYADAHAASWTAWAWFPGGCTFPALIDDWKGTPSAVGAVVKAALLGYGAPPDGPPPEPGLAYTFDQGTEGWALNPWDDPDLTNLGVHPPDGGVRPTVRFAADAGDPALGALRLTVAFTAPGQFVNTDVAFGGGGQDLSGMTVRAKLRLAAGAPPGGGLNLYACSTDAAVCIDQHIEPGALPAATWVPLTLDLAAPTVAGWNAAEISEIGVQLLSAAPAAGGETVIELDTVVAD